MSINLKDPEDDNYTPPEPPAIEWPQNTIEKGEKGGSKDDDNYFEK